MGPNSIYTVYIGRRTFGYYIPSIELARIPNPGLKKFGSWTLLSLGRDTFYRRDSIVGGKGDPISTIFMLIRWVGGVQKGQKHVDVIYGWFLPICLLTPMHVKFTL